MSDAAAWLRAALVADMKRRHPQTYPVNELQVCQDCNQASTPLTARCPVCGSGSLLTLARVLDRDRKGAA